MSDPRERSRPTTFLTFLFSAWTLAIFTVTLFVMGAASQEGVPDNFNRKDGTEPMAGLIFDASGNLYGTTFDGGAYDYGTVFELTPTAGGRWTEKILHNFNDDGKDGFGVLAGLTIDAAGNLYGTTSEGGSFSCSQYGLYGCGTIFELTPKSGGGWTEKTLHDFNGADGASPYAGLIFDAFGNLYGATTCCLGTDGYYGNVFELMPKAGGGWTEKILHNFNGTDGVGVLYGNLVFDAFGNLYGTSWAGGAAGYGVVFELTPTARGDWTERILHNFNGTDGAEPYAGVVFDAAGNLYGTTETLGPHGGTAFELTPKAGGGWAEKVLFNFSYAEGYFPYAGLILDAKGNLYGTTYEGGADGGGTVFELTPKADGRWKHEVLHNFNRNSGDYPSAGLIFDSSGNLYGTTTEGGDTSCGNGIGCGTVFELTPKAGGGWIEKVLHSFR